MVTRVVANGVAQPRRCVSFLVPAVVVFWSVAVGALAQQPGAQPPGPVKPPVAPPAATAPSAEAPTPVTEAPKLGRVVADIAALRCWPGNVAVPPVFEDVLKKDQVVALGRSENGFRAVIAPLGPLGYVSRKFTETAPDGRVKTKGTKVAFRYRSRSTEAPVTQLVDGTELHVVGEQEDWFRVRVPGVEAWVNEADVAAGADGDAALVAGYAEWKLRQEGEVKARLDLIAAALKLEQQNQADLAAVQVVQDAFTAELKKPAAEQKFEPLHETLDQLAATLTAESVGKGAIDALKKRIETQRWIAEATALRATKPEPVADATPPEVKDKLERFQSIGWVRYERRIAGPGFYYLEKGGRRQYLLSCNTARYDLALFVDREVGVLGPRRRPTTESLSVLDVERLEVLGTPVQ